MKTFLRCLTLLAALCVGWVSSAQNLGDYTFTTGVDSTKWITITGETNLLGTGNADSRASSLQNIGFDFLFAGTTYTQFSVNSDGNLRLGSTVTGTGSYSTPFSSSNSNTNSPKINFFGCDGYFLDSIHYVYAQPMVVDGDSLLVVEFRLGTYTSSTRTKKYHWQVHLYQDGKIEVVYSSIAPAQAPAVANQKGLCVNSSDGWVIASDNTATHFTAGSTTTWASGNWPAPNTYYTFEIPDDLCLSPSAITLNSISSTTASLTIVPLGEETSWYGTITPGIMGNTSMVLTDTNVNLLMLTPNTEYTVSVRAICGVGDTSNATTLTFSTPCNVQTVPYSENFDSITTSTTAATGVMPSCWIIGPADVAMTATQEPQVYYTTSYASSGNYCLRMYYRGYVAMPPMATPIQNLRLDFSVRQTSTYYQLEVGVMENPYDASTFVPIDTIINSSTTTNEDHTVYFYDYTGTGQYIAFHNIVTNTYSYSYNYIDDVEVTLAPTCRLPRNLAADNLTSHTATLSWTGDDSSYLVEYGLDTNLDQSVVATGNSYTLTGLLANSQYNVRVRTLCGTDTSEAAETTFTTPCEPLMVPYTMNFDSITTSTTSATGVMPPCWTIGARDVAMTASQEPQVYYSSSHSHSGSYTLLLYYRGYVALPKFTTAIDSLMMRFWVRQTSASYQLEVGVMSDPMDATTFVPIDTIINSSTTAQEYHEVFFDSYTGSGEYIALHNITTNTYNYSYNYIDDVEVIVIPTCVRPTDIVVSDITPVSANVSWTGSAASYVVAYGTTDDVTAMTYDTVTTNSAMLTGLTHTTGYYVYVKALCSATDESEWSLPASFYTSMMPTPINSSSSYTEDFEGTVDWMLTNDATNQWTVGNATSNGGSNALYISNDGSSNAYTTSGVQWSFAQKLFAFTAGDVIISFDWKGYGESNYDYLRAFLVPNDDALEGGVSPTGASPYAFRTVTPEGWIDLADGKLNLSSSWQTVQDTITFDSTVMYKLVFVWANDGSGGTQPPAAVDNVSLIPYVVNTCPTPTNLTVSNVTSTSADISWHLDDVTGRYFSLKINDGTNDSYQMVYDTLYTLTGLQPNSTYEVSVMTFCDTLVFSDWSDSVAFTTPCPAVVVTADNPFVETFDITSSTAYCWNSVAAGGTYDWGTANMSDYSFAAYSGLSMFFESDGFYDHSVLYSPILDLTGADSAALSFVYLNPGWAGDVNVLTVKYRTSDTAAWDTAGTYSTDVTTWTPVMVTLPNVSSTMQIAFDGYDSYGYCIGIDSVVVAAYVNTEPVCVAKTYITGDSTGNGYYTPVNNYYRYTLTETLIEASEIGGPMRIDTISYHYMHSSPMTAKTDVTIWLQPTTKTAFSSSSDIDYLDTTVAVQVFSGAMNFSQGWNDIVLPTPYMFDGTSNLMVIVDDNSYDYNSSSYKFSTANCTGYKTIAWYSDSQNPDPTNGNNSVTNSAYSGSKGYYQYRVRMAFKGCDLATCRAPYDFAASDVTATGATLSWNDNNDGATYTIYNLTDSTVVASGLTTTSYTLTGLTPNTAYAFGVEANCSATDASVMVATSFQTPCVAFSVPYTEDFDSYTTSTTAATGIEPNCWTVANQDVVWTSASSGPQIYYSTTYPHSGTYCLRLYYRCIYALPAMDTNINLLQMNFWVRQTSSYYNLAVGVMSDLNDESTFVPVDTIVCSSTTAPEEHTVYFNEYTGTGRYIAFRNICTTTYNYSYNYIDDVAVTYLPTCLPVSNLAATNVDAHSATLTWNDNSNTGATYTIYNDSTVVATGVTGTSYTFTGLLAETDYTMGVQVNCSATDVTGIDYVSFTTLAEPIMCGDDLATIVTNADSNASSTTTSYLPGYSTYNYSYTEVIVPADHLGDLNEIKGMEFKPNSVSAGSYFTNCEIYLMNTTATSLTNGFIQDTTNLQLVFSGDLSYDNTNWQQVTFDSSFVWNGTDNILVAVRRNHGSWASGSQFAAFSSTDTLARYIYHDDSAYEIGTITGGTATTTIPEYHLIGCPVDNCGTTCQITIEGADSYGDGWNGGEIYVYQNGEAIDTFTVAGSTNTENITVCSGYPVEFEWYAGMYQDEVSFTIYDGGGSVAYVCTSGYSVADSIFTTINTPCPTCLGVTVAVDSFSNNSATISWNDNNTGATYTVYNDSLVVASGLTTNSYTFTGLNGHTEYHFGVQANCSATDASAIQYVTVTTLSNPILCGDDPAMVVANADSATTTTGYFPGYSFYNYSYSEVIVPANRLTGLGEIKGMQFKPTSLNAGSSYFNNCEIYLMNTTATSLANGFIQDTTNFQLVYSGDLNQGDTNWQQVVFDTSFTWDGSSNVVVAIRRNHGSYSSSGYYAAYTSTDTLARYVYQDGGAYTIGSITGGYATTSVPLYHLIGCESTAPAPMVLNLATADSTMGTTTPAPGTYYYNVGDTMNVEAVPNSGYRFDYWIVSMGPLTDTITMNPIIDVVPVDISGYNISMTAHFAPNTVTVTVVNDESFKGTIVPYPGTYQYNVGDTVTATATANYGYNFGSWDISTSYGDTSVAMNPVTLVLPDFLAGDSITLSVSWINNEYTLTVVSNDTALGTVTGGGIYPYGSSVNITATPKPNCHFVSWSDGSTDTVHAVAIGGDTTYVATFAYDSVTIVLAVNDAATGTITPAAGTYTYAIGETFTAEATPNEGYEFLGWSYNGNPYAELTDNPVSKVLTADYAGQTLTYTAYFQARPEYTVYLSVRDSLGNANVGGTVTGEGSYYVGDEVTIVATPDNGYHFVNWTNETTGEVVSTELTYVFAMPAAHVSYIAIFAADQTEGIDDAEMDNIVIYTVNDRVIVRGAENQTIRVFDVVGRLVAQRANAADEETIQLSNTGVYLVKVGDATARRVVVRR